MGRVLPSSGEERQRAFDEVREALARHETAEEAVLRPLVREVPGGTRNPGSAPARRTAPRRR
jgi:hypothetical protein